MKKFLLLSAAAVATLGASAAVEVGFMDAEALGLANAPVFADETLLVETPSVSMYWLNEGETSKQNPDFNGMKYLIVNGEMVQLTAGIGGQQNPASVNVNDGPTKGGVQYHFVVKEDGYLIIPSKFSSNKNFYAYEGSFAGEMNLMAYTLGMEVASADYPDLTYGVYTLPADELGYCNLESPLIDNYLFGGTAVAWPIRIFTNNAEAASAGNGTGAMIFPVFKDAVDYYVFGTGTKMNTCGFVFVPGPEVPAVTVYGPARTDADGNEIAEKSFPITGELQGAGIDNIIVDAAANENAPMYNVLGQRVNESYKGLVIKNGVKFINK